MRSGSAAVPKPEGVKRSLFWETELETATQYGVAGIFLERVLECEWWREIPPEVREHFREVLEHWKQWQENVADTREHIMNFMVEHEVPIILLGATDWAYRLYPESSWRPQDKVQILVGPKHFFRTLQLLGRSGYRVVKESGDPEIYFLEKPGEGVTLEVRGHLCGEKSDEDRIAVWDRSDRLEAHVPMGARKLSPADQWAFFLYESNLATDREHIHRMNDEVLLREHFGSALVSFASIWKSSFERSFFEAFIRRQDSYSNLMHAA